MKLEIKVHNPSLSEAVQRFLFSVGIQWWDGQNVSAMSAKFLHVGVRPSKNELTWSNSSLNDPDYTKIDAATEFGKLVDLVMSKPIIIKNVTSEYDAEIAPDKSSIKVGCQTVTRAKFMEIYEAIK